MGEYSFLQTSPSIGNKLRLFISGAKKNKEEKFSELLDQIQKICPEARSSEITLSQKKESELWTQVNLEISADRRYLGSLVAITREISLNMELDLNLLPLTWLTAWPKLIVFDVDSTLIHQETIDELAGFAHEQDKVKKITQAAMEGKIAFTESLQERLHLLKGLTFSKMNEVMDKIEIRSDMADFIHTAQAKGVGIALVSGGFEFVVKQLADELNIDHFHANKLKFQDGMFMGSVEGEVVTGVKKASYLDRLCKSLGLKSQDVVVVGDGANDIPMIQYARFGIGYRPKPKLEEHAAVVLRYSSARVIEHFFQE